MSNLLEKMNKEIVDAMETVEVRINQLKAIKNEKCTPEAKEDVCYALGNFKALVTSYHAFAESILRSVP
jgi:hypothetical protein